MFLLVSGCHIVGAHLDEHQHRVYLQSVINLGKLFSRISRIFFHILDSGLNMLNGFDFLFYGVTVKTSNCHRLHFSLSFGYITD